MITTAQLIERLDGYAERQDHYAALAARGVMPITNHAAAADMAAKCEVLRSLIKVSKRDDERRADRCCSHCTHGGLRLHWSPCPYPCTDTEGDNECVTTRP